jgi:hypothetical protein
MVQARYVLSTGACSSGNGTEGDELSMLPPPRIAPPPPLVGGG